MARTATPWFDKQKKQWTVWHKGKRIRLGRTRKEAMQAYHEIMARGQRPITAGSVDEVIEHFLDWTKANRKQRTYEWYRERIKRFLDSDPPRRVAELRPLDVTQWLDAHGWGNNYKRGCITALKRAFNFAIEQELIERNPLAGLRKKYYQEVITGDEVIISPEEYQVILQSISDDPFRDLLMFLWETGCRPQEATQARPKHVDLETGTITFPPEEAPKGNKTRVIYLNDSALEIVKRHVFNDPLFVNRTGGAWTAYSINCRFDRRKERLGKKYHAYAFRHSYGYRAWVSGKIPPEEIAKLMGHADTKMIYKVYGHIEQNPQYMRDAANRIA